MNFPQIPKSLLPLSIGVGLLFFSGSIIAGVSQFSWLVVPVPGALFLVEVIVVGYLVGVYGTLYVRDKSKIVIMDSGFRESARGLTPKCDVDEGGDPWPAQSVYVVGGAAAIGLAMRGRHAVQARKSAIERFGDNTLVAYAPLQPLPAFFMKGLAVHAADQLARSTDTKFNPTGGSKSIVYYSLLDSLHGIDSEALRHQQAFIANRHGPSGADEIDRVREPGAIANAFRRLAESARPPTKRDSLRKFFTGPNQVDAEADATADKERVQ